MQLHDQAEAAAEIVAVIVRGVLRPCSGLKIRQFGIRRTAFRILLLLGRPGLKLRRHFAQPCGDPKINRRSGHGNEKLSLLTQVCTTDHGANSFAGNAIPGK
jgi:hypothetical protein